MIYYHSSKTSPRSITMFYQSQPAYFSSETDEKIKKLEGHIVHLSKNLAHRKTHGGKAFRARRISIQDQIAQAMEKIKDLESVRIRNQQGKPDSSLSKEETLCSAHGYCPDRHALHSSRWYGVLVKDAAKRS